MSAIITSLFTFISTVLGGLLALKFKDRLHLIMGFAAGVILGVVSFDIFPEIISQIKQNNLSATPVMIALVVAFLLFHFLEKSIVLHHSHEDEYAQHSHTHPDVGIMSAIALAGHSFLDGVGIGLGFQVSNSIGIIVALAVIAHDFTDGMNTVTLMLTHHNTQKKAFYFLLVDAVAPILGVAATLLYHFSSGFLVMYLGFFAGFLLYIGASDILPEAHSERSSYGTMLLTLIGVVFIFLVTRLV